MVPVRKRRKSEGKLLLKRRVVSITFCGAAVEGGAVVGIEFGFLRKPFGQVGVGNGKSPVCDEVGRVFFYDLIPGLTVVASG